MKRFLSPLFLSCSLWGITDGQVWTGSIPRGDSNITLNSGDNFTIYLGRDPNVNQAQANDFGSSGSTNLTFSTSGASLSSLTLRPNTGMSTTQFYHRQGNKISVNNNSHLTIDLQNRNNGDNRLYLFGGVIEVNQGGMMTITQLYRLSIGDNSGGAIKVNQGGKLEITQVTEVQNTRSKK